MGWMDGLDGWVGWKDGWMDGGMACLDGGMVGQRKKEWLHRYTLLHRDEMSVPQEYEVTDQALFICGDAYLFLHQLIGHLPTLKGIRSKVNVCTNT